MKWDNKYNDGVPSEGAAGAGLVIAIVAGVVVLIAVIGILAAIAIPAYHDYTQRAKVAQVAAALNDAAARVGAYVEKNGTMPGSLAAAGFDNSLPPIVQSVRVDAATGRVIATFKGAGLEGKEIAMVPTRDATGKVGWTCATITVPARYLPLTCRQTAATVGNS